MVGGSLDRMKKQSCTVDKIPVIKRKKEKKKKKKEEEEEEGNLMGFRGWGV